ncbi:MAG: hypothetical protein WDM90_12730 [Ferruginibacter sp.]
MRKDCQLLKVGNPKNAMYTINDIEKIIDGRFLINKNPAAVIEHLFRR